MVASQVAEVGGRAHDPAGVIATRRGKLAVLCPSCPRPGVNLPGNWRDEPAATKYVHPGEKESCTDFDPGFYT